MNINIISNNCHHKRVRTKQTTFTAPPSVSVTKSPVPYHACKEPKISNAAWVRNKEILTITRNLHHRATLRFRRPPRPHRHKGYSNHALPDVFEAVQICQTFYQPHHRIQSASNFCWSYTRNLQCWQPYPKNSVLVGYCKQTCFGGLACRAVQYLPKELWRVRVNKYTQAWDFLTRLVKMWS